MIFKSFKELGLAVNPTGAISSSTETKSTSTKDSGQRTLNFPPHPSVHLVMYDPSKANRNKPMDAVILNRERIPADRLIAVFYIDESSSAPSHLCYPTKAGEEKDIPSLRKTPYKFFDWYVFATSRARDEFCAHVIQQLARKKWGIDGLKETKTTLAPAKAKGSSAPRLKV